MVQPEPGIGPVTGSAGLAAGGRMIPGLGLSAEAAARIAVPGSRIRLTVLADELPDATTETLVLDLPGETVLPSSEDRVVLSAHIDGHAMDDSELTSGPARAN